MHRFYDPSLNLFQSQITLSDPNEIHHLRSVLRLKKGDTIVLFNGKGEEAEGEIIAMDAKRVEVKVEKLKKIEKRGPAIILACAIPKRGKFELIIEKATELGVDEIIPLKTERSEIHLKDERLKSKHARYQTVALNAAKQCRRSTIPVVHPVTPLTDAFEQFKSKATLVIPSLEEKKTTFLQVFSEIKSPSQIVFFIGPEGDFSPQEYALAKKAGCIPVTLGETTLRVETAAIAVVAAARLFLNFRYSFGGVPEIHE